MTPKISVIVPVYKVEKYLPKCIDSILAQTFTDFELLLIDDGSPDNSGAICDEYARRDSRIRVFHKENGGVSSARNLGIDEAKGEWIAFVDGDDWVGERYLDGFFVGYNSFDVDIILKGFTEVNSSGSNLKQVNLPSLYLKSNNIYKLLLDYYSHFFSASPWRKLFRLRVINDNKLRFNCYIDLGEDAIFLMNYLLYIDNIQLIDQVDYYYRRLDGTSLSTKKYCFEDRKYYFEEWYKSRTNLINCYDIPDKYLLNDAGYMLNNYIAIISTLYYKESNYSHSDRVMNLKSFLDTKLFKIFLKKNATPFVLRVIYILLYFKAFKVFDVLYSSYYKLSLLKNSR
ncbi:MAG: glycosyltransferase family 2 protein [Bacteroidales bacterium]